MATLVVSSALGWAVTPACCEPASASPASLRMTPGDRSVHAIRPDPASSGAALPGQAGPSVQTDTYTVLILPGKKLELAAFVEINPSTCAEISPGAWTVNTAPAHGTESSKIVSGTLADGSCAGTTFTGAAILYEMTKGSTATTDTLSATWATSDTSIPETFNFEVPTITIVSEDITQDSIVVDPEPSGLSGTLMITAVGSSAMPVVVNQSVTGGSQAMLKYGETSSPLPASKYTKLKASWAATGGSFGQTATVVSDKAIKFTALGLYENTQYNFPHESSCTGSKQPVTLWTSACVSKAAKFLGGFISQTDLNGTGVPDIGGYVHTEGFCASAGTNFRHPFKPTPSCGGSAAALTNTTLAVNFGTSANFQCGDKVLFVGEQASGSTIGISKTVTDTCPACSSVNGSQAGHVDNFTTNPDCTNVPSLPDYQAIIVGK